MAEYCYLRGDLEASIELLDSGAGDDAGDLVVALVPLLRARVLLENPTPESVAMCADLLSDAGGALVGVGVDTPPQFLRSSVADGSKQTAKEVRHERGKLSHDLDRQTRQGYQRRL